MPMVRCATRRASRTPRGGDALIDVLVAIVGELESAVGEVAAIGVGVPGLITLDGVLQSSPNVPDVIELDVAGRLAPASAGRSRSATTPRARRSPSGPSVPGAASTTW